MRIKLKRPWFAWDGGMRRANIWHEVPDDWKDKLPSDAEVAEEVVAPEPKTKKEEEKLKGAQTSPKL